ncbi:MAG: hypothetical protein LBG64_03990 [Pseudomonadales bacterium]|jgi:uncharacterized membrane protein|nr:hypothetical protein [Pseudomonadales bacterium]
MQKKIKNLLGKPVAQVVFLVIITILLRLYGVNNPVADWHSFRQADTASVAYMYFREGSIDLLRPRYQDVSNIQSGVDNPDGWRMVEFPLINGLVAWLMLTFNTDNVELTYRLVNITLAALAVAGFYLLIYELGDKKKRLLPFLCALLLATLPFSIFYSRAILPEIGVLCGHILSLYFLVKYLKTTSVKTKTDISSKNKIIWQIIYGILTTALLSSTLLIKPMGVFIAPVLIYLAFAYLGKKALIHWPLYAIAMISTAPLIMWRSWIQNFPEGVPASDWLLDGSNAGEAGMRLRFPWWRWLFIERIVKLIIGFWGLVLMSTNIIDRLKNKWSIIDGFYFVYLASMILFLIIFSTGNIQHDYYQVMIMPALIVGVSTGIIHLLGVYPKRLTDLLKNKKQLIQAALGVLSAIFLVMIFHQVLNLDETYQLLGWRLFTTIGLLLAMIAIFIFVKKNVFLATMAIVGFFVGYIALWSIVGTFFRINHPAIVEAGRTANAILPTDARVIAPHMGDTAFLFQTRRFGWPIGFDIDDKIKAGATHYVTVNMDDEANKLREKFETIIKTDLYLILDLTTPLATNSASVNGDIE